MKGLVFRKTWHHYLWEVEYENLVLYKLIWVKLPLQKILESCHI